MNKNTYNIKKLQRLNNVDQKYNQNVLKDAIIKPEKIEKPKKDNIEKIYNNTLNDYSKNIEKFWEKRVNLPYKGIIKDFDYNKKIQNEKDLVVHKVSKNDKDKVLFHNSVKKYVSVVTEQDNELHEKFSKTKLKEHKKEFEKEHRYKYISKNNNDVVNNDELRTDRIEFYKKQQEKNQENKKQLDDLLNELVNIGVIDQDLNNINYDNIDINKLEDTLVNMLGKDEYNKLINNN